MRLWRMKSSQMLMIIIVGPKLIVLNTIGKTIILTVIMITTVMADGVITPTV